MLGDLIQQALDRIGVTPARVERWIGHPCGCTERKDKLNQLSTWATRVVSGRVDKALDYLERIIS